MICGGSGWQHPFTQIVIIVTHWYSLVSGGTTLIVPSIAPYSLAWTRPTAGTASVKGSRTSLAKIARQNVYRKDFVNVG